MVDTKIKTKSKVQSATAKAKADKKVKSLKVDKKPVKAVEKKVLKPAKTVVKKAVVKVSEPKTSEKAVSVKVTVYGANGLSKGSITLPAEIFGTTPNKSLIAQAVRVYLANQRQGNASTKTRSEIVGSTRKIYRQKGTGRARHGALKAPIFVGGGVAHGPRPHSFAMDLPKKMKKAALIAALSQKAQDGQIKVVDGDFSGKTKEIAGLLKGLELVNKGKNQKVLFVIDENEKAVRAAHNVSNLKIESASTLTTYGVVVYKNIIFMKNSVGKLEERLNKN